MSAGDTENFYPDFVFWSGDAVLFVDTKGPHRLQGDAARKLLTVEPRADGSERLLVRFVSPGQYTDEMQRTGPDGFILWGMKSDGRRRPQHFESMEKAVEHLVGLGAPV